MKKSNKKEKSVFGLYSAIKQLNGLERTCKQEAEKVITDSDDKQFFNLGKKEAYSTIWFQLKPILDKANWSSTDKLMYKVLIGILSFCLGFLSCMWLFGLTNNV